MAHGGKNMEDTEHIVVADNDGYFYCRAVNESLNYKYNQQVCGIGCPCFVNSGEGRFVCKYKGEDINPPLFPQVSGLDARLYKAYAYSAQAHKGQLRKGTRIPYFSHIITTMNYAMELTSDTEVLMAAALHDTVEDTSVTIEDIKHEFGERVAFLVDCESEDKHRDRPASETWKIRKSHTVEHLKDMPLDVKIIVLADKTANAESLLHEWRLAGDKVWQKFNETDKNKQAWYYYSCAKALEELKDTSVMKKYMEYIEQIFGKGKVIIYE